MYNSVSFYFLSILTLVAETRPVHIGLGPDSSKQPAPAQPVFHGSWDQNIDIGLKQSRTRQNQLNIILFLIFLDRPTEGRKTEELRGQNKNKEEKKVEELFQAA